MSRKDWFVVDPEGLRQSSAHRRKSFILFELWQNAADTNTKKIDITLDPVEGKPLIEVTVKDDDPEGFKDLSHAYTLFAESEKKKDPEKRGFMNLGEKLVLAYCKRAEIRSTTGTVIFEEGGRRNSSKKLAAGSEFWGLIHMTRDDLADVLEDMKQIIPPKGVNTYINGELLKHRTPVTSFEATLQTRIADAEGAMRPSLRKTLVNVYERLPGEISTVYERGIPVVATGDRFHVDVQQKVPVTMDRTNLTPAFLRELRTHVLNNTKHLITEDDVKEGWVREAAGSKNVDPEAFKKVIDLRFGNKAVSADPSDREAENIAKGKGFAVVHGGSMSAGEWENARKFEALKPAGQVTPSPKPYHPDGEPLKIIPPEKYTAGMKWFYTFASDIGEFLLGRRIQIRYTDDVSWGFSGTWSRNESLLMVNLDSLPSIHHSKVNDRLIEFLIHEFAHDQGKHLEDAYDHALQEFGARLVMLALTKPEKFQ